MDFELGPLEVTARWRQRKYEIQVTNDQQHLVGYSGPPYLSRSEAITRARTQLLPRDHTLVVRHIGNGSIAYKRS